MKWFLIVLLFRGESLLDYNIYFGSSQAECEKAKALVVETPARPPLALWAGCFEIKHEVKPQKAPMGEPGTERIS